MHIPVLIDPIPVLKERLLFREDVEILLILIVDEDFALEELAIVHRLSDTKLREEGSFEVKGQYWLKGGNVFHGTHSLPIHSMEERVFLKLAGAIARLRVLGV